MAFAFYLTFLREGADARVPVARSSRPAGIRCPQQVVPCPYSLHRSSSSLVHPGQARFQEGRKSRFAPTEKLPREPDIFPCKRMAEIGWVGRLAEPHTIEAVRILEQGGKAARGICRQGRLGVWTGMSFHRHADLIPLLVGKNSTQECLRYPSLARARPGSMRQACAIMPAAHVVNEGRSQEVPA